MALFDPLPILPPDTKLTYGYFIALVQRLNSKQDGNRKRAFRRTNSPSNVLTVQHDFYTNYGLSPGSFSLMVTIKDSKNALVGNYDYQETTGDVLTITFADTTYRLTGDIVVEAVSY